MQPDDSWLPRSKASHRLRWTLTLRGRSPCLLAERLGIPALDAYASSDGSKPVPDSVIVTLEGLEESPLPDPRPAGRADTRSSPFGGRTKHDATKHELFVEFPVVCGGGKSDGV